MNRLQVVAPHARAGALRNSHAWSSRFGPTDRLRIRQPKVDIKYKIPYPPQESRSSNHFPSSVSQISHPSPSNQTVHNASHTLSPRQLRVKTHHPTHPPPPSKNISPQSLTPPPCPPIPATSSSPPHPRPSSPSSTQPSPPTPAARPTCPTQTPTPPPPPKQPPRPRKRASTAPSAHTPISRRTMLRSCWICWSRGCGSPTRVLFWGLRGLRASWCIGTFGYVREGREDGSGRLVGTWW